MIKFFFDIKKRSPEELRFIFYFVKFLYSELCCEQIRENTHCQKRYNDEYRYNIIGKWHSF